MSGGNWQQSLTAAAPAWSATTAVVEDDNWGSRALSSPDYASTLGMVSPAGTAGDRASVASSQEFALMDNVIAEEFVSEQARSSSVPADMYFGGEQQHHQQQQMSQLSEHIESVLDEESFPL